MRRSPAATGGPPLVVSVHDVAPATAPRALAWSAELAERAVPATLLVVAGPWRGTPLAHDPALAAWLRERAAAGDEVAAHGWAHHAVIPGGLLRRSSGALLARGCAEFWALDQLAARGRLDLIRAAMRDVGLDPVGFTPPGWLASHGARQAVRAAGFAYLTDHLRVLCLRTGRSILAPALSHRPGGAGERAASRALRSLAAACARSGRLTRIALHPDDLERPGLAAASLGAIEGCLAAGAQPITYAELVQRQPPTREEPGRGTVAARC